MMLSRFCLLTALSISTLSLSLPSVIAQQNSIADDAKQTHPLKVGADAPKMSLRDVDGNEVSIASLHAERPVVLVFFRGSWCPFCTRHTGELIKAYPQIKKLGAELVGVSPDNVEHSKDNVTKNGIPFPILSDADVRAAQAFGLAFEVDASTRERYKGFGIDLEKASGNSHHALPVPAVYIIDVTGKIVFAHSDPNYRERLEPKTILAELQKLKPTTAAGAR